jgi:anti-anti-sigma factor
MSPNPLVGLTDEPGGVKAKLLTERLDSDNSLLVAEQAAEAAGRPGTRLELDLGGVTFVNGGGLGGLVGMRTALKAIGVDLTLSNVDKKVFGVFAAARLDGVLDVRPAERH